MVKRFRIYGKTLQVWRSEDELGRAWVRQIEKSYVDYIWDDDFNGYIIYSSGSEDFTPKSLKFFVRRAWVGLGTGKEEIRVVIDVLNLVLFLNFGSLIVDMLKNG